MFNNTSNSINANMHINTPAVGIIQKSHKKSFFKRFHQGSPMSTALFDHIPKLGIKVKKLGFDSTEEKEIIILQVMLINDGYVLAECILIEDIE